MPRRWQYHILAAPTYTPVTAAVVRVDEWFTVPPLVQRLAGRAHLAPNFFEPERQPEPCADSWLPGFAPRLTAKNWNHLYQSITIDPVQLTRPEATTIDRWLPQGMVP